MKPNKSLIITIVLTVFLLGNVALAFTSVAEEADKFYNRFCTRTRLHSHLAFICDLRDRVDNAVGQPGPPGPQGEKGDTGDPGQQGSPGPAGTSLKVVDANGDEVGIFTGFSSSYIDGTWEVWDTTLKKFIEIKQQGGFVEGSGFVAGGDIRYLDTDCQGAPFLSNAFPYTVYQLPQGNPHGWDYAYVEDWTKIQKQVYTKSRWLYNEGCVNTVPDTLPGLLNQLIAEISETTKRTYFPPFQIVEQ